MNCLVSFHCDVRNTLPGESVRCVRVIRFDRGRPYLLLILFLPCCPEMGSRFLSHSLVNHSPAVWGCGLQDCSVFFLKACRWISLGTFLYPLLPSVFCCLSGNRNLNLSTTKCLTEALQPCTYCRKSSIINLSKPDCIPLWTMGYYLQLSTRLPLWIDTEI